MKKISSRPVVQAVHILTRLVVLLLLGFLAGCTTTSQPEDILAERVQARWDALLSGEYEEAYAYFSPGYRSTTSVIDFAVEFRMRRIRWISAEYVEKSCEEKICTVKVRVEYKVAKPVPGVPVWHSFSTDEEKWVNIDGQWWYFVET